MSVAEIRTQEQPPIPLYTEAIADHNARRWVWSASLTVDLSKFGCGHDELRGRELLPLNTYNRLIPVEEPARLIAGGIESDADSPFGTTFFTHRDPAPPGFVGQQHTGQRRTAAQLCHDILYEFNAIVPRGIGEVTALRGKFNAPSEVDTLASLYRTALPPEHRATLKQVVDWLDRADSNEIFAHSPYRDVMAQAMSEFKALALQAEFFVTDWIDKAETELDDRSKKGEGKKRLDAVDRFCLQELERTEKSLVSVTRGVESNRALGQELAGAIVEGMKANQSNDDVAELKRQMAELTARLVIQDANAAKPAQSEAEVKTSAKKEK